MKTAKEIKAAFPKGYKVIVSKNGLNVWVAYKLNNDFDSANRLVSKIAKSLGLEEDGAGTDLTTRVRDWEFTATEVVNEMCNEAREVLKSMKAFFNKWGNSYCVSSKTYDIIDKMRDLVATDEN